MIRTCFDAIQSSWRALLRFWRAIIVFLLLYSAMIGAVYLFFATREATIAQLILSFALALIAPVLFFVIQTMAVRYIANAGHARSLTVGALRDFWKLLLISLAPILIVGLMIFILAQINVTPEQAVATSPPRPPGVKPAQPLQWQAIAIASVQYLLLCLILPLTLIHLWIAAGWEGLKAAVAGSFRILGRALAPGSVLTYVIGFLFFAVAPYFLLFSKTEASSTWLDIALFSGRLALAVLLSLLSWVATVGALATLARGDASRAADESARDLVDGRERAPVGS